MIKVLVTQPPNNTLSIELPARFDAEVLAGMVRPGVMVQIVETLRTRAAPARKARKAATAKPTPASKPKAPAPKKPRAKSDPFEAVSRDEILKALDVPRTLGDLCDRLRLDRDVVKPALAAIERDGLLVKGGKARATTYQAARPPVAEGARNGATGATL